MFIGGKHYTAADVLAGAYIGPRSIDRALVHTVELAGERAFPSYVRVLCKSVDLGNLIDDSGDPEREPTCPRCAAALARIREKARELDAALSAYLASAPSRADPRADVDREAAFVAGWRAAHDNARARAKRQRVTK